MRRARRAGSTIPRECNGKRSSRPGRVRSTARTWFARRRRSSPSRPVALRPAARPRRPESVPHVFHVELACSADLGPIRILLEASGLPSSDLASASPQFLVIRNAGRIVASGALERFGPEALLRSVVVAPDQRSRGLGRRMTRELERLAQNTGVAELILLTDTASEFFERQGYRVIARDAAPAAVQQSAEFRTLCPSSATCMAKSLGGLQL